MPAPRSLLVGAALIGLVTAGCSGTGSGSRASTSTAAAATAPATTAAPRPAATSTSARPAPSRSTPRPLSSAPATRPRSRATSHAATRHASTAGGRLPLDAAVGNARQVITVTAPSYGSSVGTLQRWSRTAAGGWQRVGAPATAHLGSDGLSSHPSESLSATPVGSFTLTRAFGHDADPGTRLPYTHTTPADWWVSQAGPLYNTLQHCDSGCGFTQGDPNEHLYYETPYYNFAVVIDYNTRNAPGGVHQGAGSAFFLHVTDGSPTAGCVAIPQSDVVDVLRWLVPGDHPRIVIGVS